MESALLRRRRLLLALCALASEAAAGKLPRTLAAAPTSAPTPTPTPAADAIRIGVSGPFSGASSRIGESMRNGIRIAASTLNARGGVLGLPLQLIERDDEASNERGAQIAHELIHAEHVVASVGIVNTGVALASQRHYQLARVPMITAVATGTLITRQFHAPDFPENYIFRVAASDDLQARVMVNEALDGNGAERLAIFHDGTNYGVLGSEELVTVLAARARSAALVERFPPHESEQRELLQRARAAGVNAILVYGAGPEQGQIANGLARMGWRVPLIGTWMLGCSNFIADAGANAEGARMPQTFIEDDANPAHAEFLRAWHVHTGSARIAVPPAAAQGYDSMLILAAAIHQAGSREGKHIREALENLHAPVQGVIMAYHSPYSRSQHETLTEPRQLQIGEIRGGRVVPAPPRRAVLTEDS